MADDPQYRPDRRILPTPAVERVGTVSEADELRKQKTIEAMLERMRPPKKKFVLPEPPSKKK